MRAYRVGSRVPARRTIISLGVVLSLASADAAATAQTPAAASVASKPSFDELYRRGQKANAGITRLTARFTETTSSSLLVADRPVVARGSLYVQRGTPSRVALHYTEPDARTVLIDGNRMITSWPSRNIRTSSDISRAQRDVEKYFTANDAGDLRRLFTIDLHDTSARPGTHEVSMVPRRKQISETLTRLELWVQEGSGLLQAMRMTFSNGDTKLMEFENVTPNAAIDPSVFAAPK